VYGPRLTNSTGFLAAADWVVAKLKEWGIPAQLEPWGPYGRGWSITHFSAHMIEPQYSPLIGFPLAWTPGTKGPVTAEVMLATIATEKDFDTYRGKLWGKIVLQNPPRDLQLSLQPLGRRLTDSELAERALTPVSNIAPQPPAAAGNANRDFQNKLLAFLRDEAPAAVVRIGASPGDGGTVFGQGGGSRDPKDPQGPPMLVLTPEHYNRMVRLIDHKIPVKIELDIATRFDDRTESVNVIGQINGGRKKDEIVMIGAHLDSWQGGTGATDNAAGSSVMIEAMRILKTLNLKLDRSVRIGLWGGEEEGLLGSRAYVAQHFAKRETMKVTPEHAKLSVYFNVDAGSGKIRGMNLGGNDMLRPIVESWFKPFSDLGAGTISNRTTGGAGGTDHQSFDAVGLPGFSFIQDPLEYGSRTHHSNMDVYDRIQGGDLAQMAAIVASFAYHAANREQILPRKALPKPQPAPRSGAASSGTPGN
jgi:carboxypeptidase Q